LIPEAFKQPHRPVRVNSEISPMRRYFTARSGVRISAAPVSCREHAISKQSQTR